MFSSLKYAQVLILPMARRTRALFNAISRAASSGGRARLISMEHVMLSQFNRANVYALG
jgi:hypothetical protein